MAAASPWRARPRRPPRPRAPTTFVCPSALLLLQEAPGPEPAGGRAEAVRHGTGLLDRLDELRLALLCGAVPPARLRAIADALAARSVPLGDPRLDAVIAEIELRCAVELAKFHRANRRAVARSRPRTGFPFLFRGLRGLHRKLTACEY